MLTSRLLFALRSLPQMFLPFQITVLPVTTAAHDTSRQEAYDQFDYRTLESASLLSGSRLIAPVSLIGIQSRSKSNKFINRSYRIFHFPSPVTPQHTSPAQLHLVTQRLIGSKVLYLLGRFSMPFIYFYFQKIPHF